MKAISLHVSLWDNGSHTCSATTEKHQPLQETEWRRRISKSGKTKKIKSWWLFFIVIITIMMTKNFTKLREFHKTKERNWLTCKFREYHSFNYSRQETAINVFLLLNALLVAIEQQCLKPQHVLKVWAVLLHTEDTMLSLTKMEVRACFITIMF